MKLKRLVGADQGWGGAAGTLLLLGFGLFVLAVSVAGLKEASRVKPEERGCTEWLADPSGARWVSLVGCQLDLTAAASDEWKAVRTTKVFIPLFTGAAPAGPPRGVLASADPEPQPGVLTGYVERVSPALRALTADGAVVLDQGRQPPRATTLLGLLLGLIAVALAVRSMALRYLVDRDSTSA